MSSMIVYDLPQKGMEYNSQGESLVNSARTATALAVPSSPHQVPTYRKEAGALHPPCLHNLDFPVKLIPKLIPCRYVYILKFSH